MVGRGGEALPGSQRQRRSLHRPRVLADPRILILDEGHLSLDSESEALIQEGLAHLLQGRTTFVMRAPALDDPPRGPRSWWRQGEVVEQGTHASCWRGAAAL